MHQLELHRGRALTWVAGDPDGANVAGRDRVSRMLSPERPSQSSEAITLKCNLVKLFKLPDLLFVKRPSIKLGQDNRCLFVEFMVHRKLV